MRLRVSLLSRRVACTENNEMRIYIFYIYTPTPRRAFARAVFNADAIESNRSPRKSASATDAFWHRYFSRARATTTTMLSCSRAVVRMIERVCDITTRSGGARTRTRETSVVHSRANEWRRRASALRRHVAGAAPQSSLTYTIL